MTVLVIYNGLLWDHTRSFARFHLYAVQHFARFGGPKLFQLRSKKSYPGATTRLYAEGGPQPSYGEKEAFNFTVLVPPGESSSCK